MDWAPATNCCGRSPRASMVLCVPPTALAVSVAMSSSWSPRNCYVVFESGMQDAVQSRMELEMDLRVALENDEFFLVYQPTFDLQDMSPTGITVNVSGRQLDTDQLIADIEGALSQSALDASALTIEITETTLMRNVEETAIPAAKIPARLSTR
jgi:predicted signal transduction protein with EAL and GGDEF domain